MKDDLVRAFKCYKTGPVIYIGLMTRKEVRDLQIKSKCVVWWQTRSE